MGANIPTHEIEGSGGQTLIFLHGIGGNRGSFEASLAHFAPRWRAVAWDMPGYGGSPLGDEMTWAGLADALVRLMDHLGVERSGIVGHSMGGMVAQELAIRRPERVSALVLSATSARFGSADGSFQENFLAARLAPLERGLTPADIAPQTMPAMFADSSEEAAILRAVEAMATIPAATYRAALQCLVSFDRRDDLGRITAPTLLLSGAKDEVAPAKGMARMAQRIPNSRHHSIPGVGHLANLERPDLFNRSIAEFLAEVEAQAAA